MLDSILINGDGVTNLTVPVALLCTAVSVVIGIVIACVYMFCSKRYTRDYVITIVILPVLVQTVIMLVNGNLGAGVAVMGAFSLVRFRSLPGSAKEIGVIFFAMATGLATGMGYIVYALGITVIVSLLLVLVTVTNFGESKKCMKKLKVTIPEDLDYTEMFDDIFEKYTTYSEIENVKTTNLGSLFTVTYDICFKANANEKEFIDDIRCRNGNLTVSIGRDRTDMAL